MNELLTASDSRNREHAKAHALWPLLFCDAVALRRRLVLVCFFFLCVWWCGVVLRVLVDVVFVALCCVHGVVRVLVVFMVVCVVFLALVFMESLMALWVRLVLLGVSRDAQQTHYRTQHAIKKRLYVFKKHMSSHSKPLKATVSHITFSKSHWRATPSHSKPLSSHVEPLKSHVRFLNSKFAVDRRPFVPCSRWFLLAHRYWSPGCIGQLFNFRARPPHQNQQHTHHGSRKLVTHP